MKALKQTPVITKALVGHTILGYESLVDQTPRERFVARVSPNGKFAQLRRYVENVSSISSIPRYDYDWVPVIGYTLLDVIEKPIVAKKKGRK